MTRWDAKTLFEMYDRLREVMYDREARAWLVSPNAALGERAPCEVIVTPTGYQRAVRTLDARVKDLTNE